MPCCDSRWQIREQHVGFYEVEEGLDTVALRAHTAQQLQKTLEKNGKAGKLV